MRSRSRSQALSVHHFPLLTSSRGSAADKSGFALIGQTGSFLNMAPEVVLSQPYDEKVDIFSLGCCLFEVPSH